jgi:antitoxin ParD1/3/4
MQTMNISLPDPLKQFVDAQIASGRYSSVSEYIRELIRQDETRKAREKLETFLLEGVRSGDPSPIRPEDWTGIRREAEERREARKTRSGG